MHLITEVGKLFRFSQMGRGVSLVCIHHVSDGIFVRFTCIFHTQQSKERDTCNEIVTCIEPNVFKDRGGRSAPEYI